MTRISPRAEQGGQAYAEFVVGIVVVGLFLFGAYHIWRYAEARQALLSAVRFATWERTVWEPSDNSVEKHALHRSDDSVARETLVHQLSSPEAWRRERTGVMANGAAANVSVADRQSMLKPALKSFIEGNAEPAAMLTVSTNTQRQMGLSVGRDPTFNTTTSLELDRDVYRSVTVTLRSPMSASRLDRLLSFALPKLDSTRSMSLLTNSWAASVPVSRIRITNQLMPLSPGDSISGTKANFLAFFGQDSGPGLQAGDFVGMVPWWNLVGGQNGFAGQYAVHKIGLDAAGLNNIVQNQSWAYDPNKPVAANFFLQPQLERNEYFQPTAVSAAFPRFIVVQDKTADAQSDVPRNSIMGGKRKYMAFSLQNPIENFFRP